MDIQKGYKVTKRQAPQKLVQSCKFFFLKKKGRYNEEKYSTLKGEESLQQKRSNA